jgi:hypothetical protein
MTNKAKRVGTDRRRQKDAANEEGTLTSNNLVEVQSSNNLGRERSVHPHQTTLLAWFWASHTHILSPMQGHLRLWIERLSGVGGAGQLLGQRYQQTVPDAGASGDWIEWLSYIGGAASDGFWWARCQLEESDSVSLSDKRGSVGVKAAHLVVAEGLLRLVWTPTLPRGGRGELIDQRCGKLRGC